MKKILLIAFLLSAINLFCFSQKTLRTYDYKHKELNDYFINQRNENQKLFNMSLKINQGTNLLLIHNLRYHQYTWLSITAISTLSLSTSSTMRIVYYGKTYNLKTKVKYIKRKKPLRLINGSEIIYLD